MAKLVSDVPMCSLLSRDVHVSFVKCFPIAAGPLQHIQGILI
jgi:hypothetical protein